MNYKNRSSLSCIGSFPSIHRNYWNQKEELWNKDHLEIKWPALRENSGCLPVRRITSISLSRIDNPVSGWPRPSLLTSCPPTVILLSSSPLPLQLPWLTLTHRAGFINLYSLWVCTCSSSCLESPHLHFAKKTLPRSSRPTSLKLSPSSSLWW